MSDLLVDIFATSDMPSHFNVNMAAISRNQIRIVSHNPLVADYSVTVTPLVSHTTTIFRKSVISDASGIEATFRELPLARTVQTGAPTPQMRSHIAWRMQHEFLHCIMLVWMGGGIRKLGTHNTVDSFSS